MWNNLRRAYEREFGITQKLYLLLTHNSKQCENVMQSVNLCFCQIIYFKINTCRKTQKKVTAFIICFFLCLYNLNFLIQNIYNSLNCVPTKASPLIVKMLKKKIKASVLIRVMRKQVKCFCSSALSWVQRNKIWSFWEIWSLSNAQWFNEEALT